MIRQREPQRVLVYDCKGRHVVAPNRRDFIKSSAAITLFTVSRASAQPVIPRRIAFVHSTAFDAELLDCFWKGLSFAGWERPPTAQKSVLPVASNPIKEARGQYNGADRPGRHAPLRALVRQHGRPHLIVAAGGLISQASAREELNRVAVPYVYVGGRPPTTTDAKSCGVILNGSAQFNAAVTALNVPRSGVYLLQNNNSEMADDEAGQWRQAINSNVFRFFDRSPFQNDSNIYDTEVTRLSRANPPPTGVVVSSDPYFRLTAGAFTNAMANLRVPVCYPFKDFNPSQPNILLPNGAKLSAPSSSSEPEIRMTAYCQLGLRAGDILNNSTDTNPVPTTPRRSVSWTGSNWQVV